MTTHALPPLPNAAAAPGRRRRLRLGFRIPATLVTLVMALTGGHNLVVGWFDPADGGAHRLQDLHWGVAEGLLLAVGLGMQLRRPERHAGAMRVVTLAVVAQALVAVAGLSPDPFGLVLLVLVGIALWQHPARREVLRPVVSYDRLLLPVAVPAAAALLGFAAVQVAHHFTAPSTDVLEVTTGWIGAAISTTALALVLLAGACLAGRAAKVFAAAGLAVLGLASVLHPHAASSLSLAGGCAALLVAAVSLRAALGDDGDLSRRGGPAGPPA